MDSIMGIVAKCMQVSVMELILFITVTVLILLLTYMQIKKDSVDLRWLILDDKTGRPSIHKVGQCLALLVSTWAFVKLVVNDRFTTDYLLIYMGVWAGSTALNQWLGNRVGQIQQSTQVTTVVTDSSSVLQEPHPYQDPTGEQSGPKQ